MASKRRADPALQARIARLRLPLAALRAMPSGPVHPAFPPTLLAYNLLTEPQLDALAHHYHQSTPGVWTNHYPIAVLWPRRLSVASLASPAVPQQPFSSLEQPRRASAPSVASATTAAAATAAGQSGGVNGVWDAVLNELIQSGVRDAETLVSGGDRRRWSAILRDDAARIAMKRRKFGKFIGLRGMDTPAAEVEARMEYEFERSLRTLVRERRTAETRETGMRKAR